MRLAIRTEGMSLDRFSENFLAKKSESFRKRVGHRAPEDSELKIKVAGKAAKSSCSLDIDLDLKGHHIHVHKQAPNLQLALKSGINSLFCSYNKLRLKQSSVVRQRVADRLSPEQVEKRQFQRQTLKQAGVSPDVVGDLYSAAMWFATHELAYKQAVGDLEPGYVEPADIADQVMVDLLSAMNDNSTLSDLKNRLHQLLAKRLQSVSEEYADAANQLVSTDTDIPEVSPGEELTLMGDEIFDFWVADEDLRLEDVLPDPACQSPETVVSDREGRNALINALIQIPQDARWAFGALALDETQIDDVARYLQKTAAEVEALAKDAQKRLGDLLSGELFQPQQDDVIALYRQLAQRVKKEVGLWLH